MPWLYDASHPCQPKSCTAWVAALTITLIVTSWCGAGAQLVAGQALLAASPDSKVLFTLLTFTLWTPSTTDPVAPVQVRCWPAAHGWPGHASAASCGRISAACRWTAPTDPQPECPLCCARRPGHPTRSCRPDAPCHAAPSRPATRWAALPCTHRTANNLLRSAHRTAYNCIAALICCVKVLHSLPGIRHRPAPKARRVLQRAARHACRCLRCMHS